MNDDFRPSASIQTLRRRAEILQQIRRFFERRNFFEVQTPALSRDTVVDRFIHPISVSLPEDGWGGGTGYLQTSPEFAMKRLLASGADSIYQIGPVFRAGERGPLHNPEFCMLEWYRTGDSYQEGMDLLDDFAREILGCPPAVRQTYDDLLRQILHIDRRTPDGQRRLDQHRQAVGLPEGDWTGTMEHLFAEQIEPRIASEHSLIIYDWPADQSALAQTRGDVAERFELYVNGIELANGYHELTDTDELLARNAENNRIRQHFGHPVLPVESRLTDAMRHGLPDSCGVALGLDRLIMVALGKSTIAEVMAFDVHRA